MIIKSKIIFILFFFNNNNLTEVSVYRYHIIDFYYKLNLNYIIEKTTNGELKAYYGLENNHELVDLWL
jgi:hypothetical protein